MSIAANKPRTEDAPIAELALYADGLVLLTDRRVVFGNRTYWHGRIRSVGVGAVSARGRFLSLLIYMFAILSYVAILYWQSTSGQQLDWLSGGVFYVGLAILLAGAVYMLVRLRASGSATLYFIRLNGRRVLVSLDERYARWLAGRIVRARRGEIEYTEPLFSEASQERAPGEYLYYSDGFTWVTSHIVRFGHREFAVPDIKVVKVGQLPSSQFQWRLALAVAMLVGSNMLNYLWLTYPDLRSRFYLLYPGDYWILSILLFAGFLVLLVWAVGNLEQSTHVLQLRGTFGKVSALATMDSYYCKRLEESIKSVASGRISRTRMGDENVSGGR